MDTHIAVPSGVMFDIAFLYGFKQAIHCHLNILNKE